MVLQRVSGQWVSGFAKGRSAFVRWGHKNMSKQLRFGLASENAYFNRIDQMLLENLRETLELQEEARQCAEAGRRPSRDVNREGFANEEQTIVAGFNSSLLDA